jgi:glutathione peroxidase
MLNTVEHVVVPPGASRARLRPLRVFAAALAAGLATAVQAGGLLDDDAVAAATTPLVPAHWIQAAATPAPSADCPPLLQHTFNRLQTGEPQSLCQYQGKVLLIVNTASYCGYTKQYEALEAMYRRYKDRGLVVVGFPSNDFSQEPGNNKEIAEFCRTTYGVQFPLYEKTTVSQPARNPLYGELAKATGKAPQWNFHKYVVDRSGKPVASFASAVMPDAREITSLIEKLLEQKPPPVRG